MALTGGLQKAKVARQDLPALSVFSDGSIGHYVRYRIISEDRNRYSHWSPVYLVGVEPFTLLGEVKVSYTTDTITAVWGDALDRPRYDVFVRWGNGVDRVSSTGTTRTVRTHTDHGFSQGDRITISGTTVNYNGTWTITSTTHNTITFTGSNPQTENNTVVDGEAIQSAYYYHGTPTVHTYSFLRLPGFDRLHVDVQVESINKVYNTDLLVYDSPSIALT
jgi:hypothetical protein